MPHLLPCRLNPMPSCHSLPTAVRDRVGRLALPISLALWGVVTFGTALHWAGFGTHDCASSLYLGRYVVSVLGFVQSEASVDTTGSPVTR